VGMNLLLECPNCAARYPLKRHEPDRRVRCRKCRAPMVIPRLPWEEVAEKGEAPQLAPEVKAKIVRSFRLRRWLLASVLFVLSAGLGVVVLIRRMGSQAGSARAESVDSPMSFEKVFEENRRSPLPLKTGYEWVLKSGGTTEERRVIGSHLGPGNLPQFEMAVTGRGGGVRRLLRCGNDGVRVVEEVSATGKKTAYHPPYLWIPRPLHMDSRWSHRGGVEEDGRFLELILEYRVAYVEAVTTPAGTYSCYKVEITGRRGTTEVNEAEWLALGVGLVKRRLRASSGELDEFLLQRASRPSE